MLERYSTPRFEQLWSDKNKFYLMWVVELAILRSMEHHCLVPYGISESLKDKIQTIDIDRVKAWEETTKY